MERTRNGTTATYFGLLTKGDASLRVLCLIGIRTYQLRSNHFGTVEQPAKKPIERVPQVVA